MLLLFIFNTLICTSKDEKNDSSSFPILRSTTADLSGTFTQGLLQQVFREDPDEFLAIDRELHPNITEKEVNKIKKKPTLDLNYDFGKKKVTLSLDQINKKSKEKKIGKEHKNISKNIRRSLKEKSREQVPQLNPDISSGEVYSIDGIQTNFSRILDLSDGEVSSDDNIILKSWFSDESAPKDINIRIAVFNSYDRYTTHKEKIYSETSEIIQNAESIIQRGSFKKYNISLHVVDIINFTNKNTFTIENLHPGDEEKKKEDRLNQFSGLVSKFEANDWIPTLQSINLSLLFTTYDGHEIEGASFIGGAEDKDSSYGVIGIDDERSSAYNGKVVAHEILHLLGSIHDEESGCLMTNYSSDQITPEKIRPSNSTVKNVETFIFKNIDRFA